jgi:hypothetical protein
MEIKTFTSLESTFLSKLNEGFNTFDKLKDNVPFNEKTLNGIIESMISKNVIKFDSENKKYIYDSPVKGNIVILDGNIMLPTTVLRMENRLLVTRGQWYEFDLDFDIRRIIWNVQLASNSKSTLVELIQQSVLKEKKSKVIQLPEYINLVNKLVPWSENIKLKINAVGEDITDVSLIFVDKLYLEGSKDDFVEFREFYVKTEILTNELTTELMLPAADRNFQNIKLNRIFNFSDFVFSGNSIPYLNDDESICYGKITGIRGKFELTYFRFDNTGSTEKLNVEEYMDATEGIEKIKELFVGYAESLLGKNDFLIEITE